MTKEEAIKIVRENMHLSYDKGNTFKALQTLVPELAEWNENERIRKEISTLYADIDSCISELLAARINKDAEAEGKALFRMEGLMVATLQDLSCVEDWLEKQKEPVVDKEGMYYYIGGKFIYCGYPATEENPYNFAMSQQEKQKDQKSAEYPEKGNEYWFGFNEGKGTVLDNPEQFGLYKPAEWNEADEEMLDAMIDIVSNSLYEPLCPREGMLAWLKSLRPQPKQEWSEEDEKEVAILEGYICSKDWSDRHIDRALGIVDELVNKVKSLRHQPKQEWSKEDKQCFDEAIEALESLDFNGEASNLKFLRDCRKPLNTWKPSEQEKGALKTAISVLKEERNFPKAAANLQTILDAFDGKETHKEWKPSKISLEALHTAVYLPEMEFYGGLKDKLCILYEQLKKLGVREEPEYYQHFDPDC